MSHRSFAWVACAVAWTCDIARAVAGERVLLFLRVSDSGELSIAHSGRGRMPIREVDGQRHATFFGDISFPAEIVHKLTDQPDAEFRQGILLQDLKQLVERTDPRASNRQDPRK